MEFQLNALGKKVYPNSFKKQLLDELRTGLSSAADLSRKYEIPMQNLIRWRKKEIEGQERIIKREAKAEGKDESELLVAYRKLTAENEKLRRTVANLALDRDILQDAVNIAAKKKWI